MAGPTKAQLLSRVAALERDSMEKSRAAADTREQQAATSEILRLISTSTTDATPVFEAIAVHALRLCGAEGAVVVRLDGGVMHVVAHHNITPEAVDLMRRQSPFVLDRGHPLGRAILDRTIVHVPDLQAATEFTSSFARQFGRRGHVSVPLLSQGEAVGGIGISRREPGPFSDRQLAVLRTFADEAVIALENVRLFNETREALEQQTATAEILRVISGLPTDVQPVFDAIARSAARLCEALDASIFRVDADRLTFVAHHGPIAQRHGDFSLPLVGRTVGGRSVLESRTIQVADLQNEDREFPDAVENARRFGFRTILSVPLLRDGIAIGGIQLRRGAVQLFSERQVALLQTFADQAVIAIENVRLFTELQEKNAALMQAHAQVTEALEQQTATSEILRVIASSPADVVPVFEAILQSAVELSDSAYGVALRYDGEVLHVMAHHNQGPEGLASCVEHTLHHSASGHRVRKR